MQEMIDLFGNVVEAKKPAQRRQSAPKPKMEIDRRKLWPDGGGLLLIEEDDDDISVSTTECFTENATIERLEQALNMKPLLVNGEWKEGLMFWEYKLTKPITGARDIGPVGSMLRQCQHFMMQDSARKVLDESFTDTGGWLPRYAFSVFSKRLSMALPHEDPYALLHLFTTVMTQHDYLDESRKGESLRRAVKRERMRSQRAQTRSKPVFNDDFDDDSDFAESA